MSDIKTAQISFEFLTPKGNWLTPRIVLGGEVRIAESKAHSDTIRVYGVRDRLVYFVLTGEIKIVSNNTLEVDFTIDFDRGLGEFTSPVPTPVKHCSHKSFTTNEGELLDLNLPQNLRGRLNKTADRIYIGEVYRGSEIESFHLDPRSKAQIQLTLI